jgi:hypothetical protein
MRFRRTLRTAGSAHRSITGTAVYTTLAGLDRSLADRRAIDVSVG